MSCWYCFWGWSKPVREIYERHVAVAGESPMHFGPAHIVWEDENFGRENVQWCLDACDERQGDFTPEELAAVRASLEELLLLPDDVRDPEPDDYDGGHPERFPPTIPMIKRHEVLA